MSAVIQIEAAQSHKANEKAQCLMRVLAAKFASEGKWIYFAAMKWLAEQMAYSKDGYLDCCVRDLKERFGL